MKTTIDLNGETVSIGQTIKVLEIDERIMNFLPSDEIEELNEFIGEELEVRSINSDGSMVVSKSSRQEETGVTSGHEIAIFSKGALLVK